MMFLDSWFVVINKKFEVLSNADTVTSGNLLHKTVLSEGCTPNLIRKIVRDYPELINGVNSEGSTPLHLVLHHYPRYEIIYELLCLGADVNAIADVLRTPILAVVWKYLREQILIMDCLLRYNAEVNQMSWDQFVYENVNESSIHQLLSVIKKHSITDAIALEQSLKNMPRYIAAAKLLMEFGGTFIIRSWKCLKLFKYSKRLLKLYLQYFAINLLKISVSSGKNVCSPHQYYDFLVNEPYDCIFKKISALKDSSDCDYELLMFRDTLVRELIDMMNENIDGSFTLFSFVSEHCCSGLFYIKMETSMMIKILSLFYFKQYTCCRDLIDASLKHNFLLSILYKLDIYVIKNFSANSDLGKKVRLNYLEVSYLVKYLSKEDIINLILAYFPIDYEEKSHSKSFLSNQVNLKSEISKESCMSLDDMKEIICYCSGNRIEHAGADLCFCRSCRPWCKPIFTAVASVIVYNLFVGFFLIYFR